MSQIYIGDIGGHSFAFENNRLLIDDELVDVKLKRSLIGGHFMTCSIIDDDNGKTEAKIKIGRNTIILKDNKVTVNGEEVVSWEQEIVDVDYLEK